MGIRRRFLAVYDVNRTVPSAPSHGGTSFAAVSPATRRRFGSLFILTRAARHFFKFVNNVFVPAPVILQFARAREVQQIVDLAQIHTYTYVLDKILKDDRETQNPFYLFPKDRPKWGMVG